MIGRLITIAICAATCIVTAGCGESTPPAYPTKITLKLTDGRPAVGARITLMPVDGNFKSFGVADSEGVAKMSTFGDGDGAVAGRHMVAVGPPATDGDPDVNRPPYAIASRLASFTTSQLEFEVDPNKEVNEFNVNLPLK
jgi:hypothetical protein